MGNQPPFQFKDMESNAAKIVSGAVLGIDYRSVTVNGRLYVIMPPTIRRIAGAAYRLSSVGGTMGEILASRDSVEAFAQALSWFIAGDESLADELMEGTAGELAEALEEAYSLLSVENFTRLSILAGNVAKLAARQRLQATTACSGR